MKALVRTRYGSPDILELQDIDTPTPKDNQVLIRIHAASVNPVDWHILRGKPFLVRLAGFGLLKPKYQIIGADVAGRVEAVGKDVTQFRVGDEVFGGGRGSFAEYVCVSAKQLALKPSAMTFEQAASLPVAGLTALQGLRDHGKIQSRHHVLINGASGGVGTFAVQIAKAMGAEVTGVCSGENLDLVRSIGADHVIDYVRNDFTKGSAKYDLILDNAAYRPVARSVRTLTPAGTYVLVGGAMWRFFQSWFLQLRYRKAEGKKVTSMLAKVNSADLTILGEMVMKSEVVPQIEKRYPLREVPRAIRDLETGHTRGKVVITVG